MSGTQMVEENQGVQLACTKKYGCSSTCHPPHNPLLLPGERKNPLSLLSPMFKVLSMI